MLFNGEYFYNHFFFKELYVAGSLHESGYKADTQARHSSVVIWDFAQLRDHRKSNTFHGIIKQSVICNL